MIVMMPHLTAAGTKYIIIICYRCWSCPRIALEIIVFRVDRQRFLKRASCSSTFLTPTPSTILFRNCEPFPRRSQWYALRHWYVYIYI